MKSSELRALAGRFVGRLSLRQYEIEEACTALNAAAQCLERKEDVAFMRGINVRVSDTVPQGELWLSSKDIDQGIVKQKHQPGVSIGLSKGEET